MNMASDSLEQEGGIDLRLLAARLWAKRWWIVASMIVFTAAFIGFAFWMTPMYRATTVLVPAGGDKGGMGSLASSLGQLGGLASLAGVNIGSGDSQTNEALAVLRSREFTEAFIHDAQLMPELFHARWDAANRRWKGEEKNWPTLAQAFKFFDKQVRAIGRDKATGLVTIDIKWRDGTLAAAWANDLVKRLNAEMRARATASTNASVGYLEKELAATSAVETRQSINHLMEAQLNQKMLANVTEEYAFRVVDRALPPDPKDVVGPGKPMMAALGLLIGVMFGAFGVLVSSSVGPPT